MPVPKRYFHCSQDILADPEVWEMIKEFGDRFILTWLQILIYLERTDNQWRLSGDWLAILSRSVRQSSANLRRQVGQLVAKGWLEVGETSADGSPLVLKGRNWLKYNNRREHKKRQACSPPFLSFPFHSLPKEEEKTPPQLALTVEEVMSVWNETAGVKKAQSATGPIKKLVERRIKEHPDLQWFKDLFQRVGKSEFLTGRSTDFTATLDWVLGPKNLAKIENGNYDNRQAKVDTRPIHLRRLAL